MSYYKINIEDFLDWAKHNKDKYYDLYDDYLSEHISKDPDDYLVWANNNVEDFEHDFDEFIYDIIDELEQDDYFGTDGFNKRFA